MSDDLVAARACASRLEVRESRLNPTYVYFSRNDFHILRVLQETPSLINCIPLCVQKTTKYGAKTSESARWRLKLKDSPRRPSRQLRSLSAEVQLVQPRVVRAPVPGVLLMDLC